jgi:hypothetical protein
MIAALALTSCGSGSSEESAEPEENTAAEETTTEETTEPAQEETDGLEYNKIGYVGTDAAEFATYKYLVDEIGKNYEAADASIPVVTIVDKDESNPDDVLVKGDFWLYNYKIEGDTLKCVSGGAHPGCMHMKKNDDGTYTVTSFDPVADGSDYDASAKEIFGDKYEDFSKVSSDADAREAKRLEAVTAYVNANEVPCTKYQDEGWDPVDLHL